MKRKTLLMFLCFSIQAAGLGQTAPGQTAPSDSQTLQSLLSEVRELHQELHSSLARMQKAQVLLIRWQSQQSVVERASQRLDEARTKLAGEQDHQRRIALDSKRLEEDISAEQIPAQQKVLQDQADRLKADYDASTKMIDQDQQAEIDCEQKLRNEQDKLDALDAELDEIVKSMGSADGQSAGAPR
jgi:HD-GYP domain-containing protein (c-di-GMP phosphodiesterase class II)